MIIALILLATLFLTQARLPLRFLATWTHVQLAVNQHHQHPLLFLSVHWLTQTNFQVFCGCREEPSVGDSQWKGHVFIKTNVRALSLKLPGACSVVLCQYRQCTVLFLWHVVALSLLNVLLFINLIFLSQFYLGKKY